jgi:hypothetical protein
MKYKKVIIISSFLLAIISCADLSRPFSPQLQASQTVGRFQVSNGVAVDTHSNLMWSRCLVGATWNGTTCEGTPNTYSWQQIQTLVKSLNYAGYSDWRIPTLEELKSLADKESIPPAIKVLYLNQTVFPLPNCLGPKSGAAGLQNNGHACWHWTSTPIEGSHNYAWIVYFGYGYGSASYETDTFALRLVRNN